MSLPRQGLLGGDAGDSLPSHKVTTPDSEVVDSGLSKTVQQLPQDEVREGGLELEANSAMSLPHHDSRPPPTCYDSGVTYIDKKTVHIGAVLRSSHRSAAVVAVEPQEGVINVGDSELVSDSAYVYTKSLATEESTRKTCRHRFKIFNKSNIDLLNPHWVIEPEGKNKVSPTPHIESGGGTGEGELVGESSSLEGTLSYEIVEKGKGSGDYRMVVVYLVAPGVETSNQVGITVIKKEPKSDDTKSNSLYQTCESYLNKNAEEYAIYEVKGLKFQCAINDTGEAYIDITVSGIIVSGMVAN